MPKTTQFKPRQSGSRLHALNHDDAMLYPWDILSPRKRINEPTVLPGSLMARTHLCQVPSQDWMFISCPLHLSSSQERSNQMTGDQSPWSHEHYAVTGPVTRPSLICDGKWLSPWSCLLKVCSGIRNWTPTSSTTCELQGPGVWWMAQLEELLQMAQPACAN